MAHNFEPLPRVVEHVGTLGLTWQEVERDLEQGHGTPAYNQPGKRRIVGEQVEAIVADESPAVVLYVRRRNQPCPGDATFVVGRERKRRMPKSKGGGAGNRWATSWGELIKLAERNKDVRVVQGSKHYIVLKGGKQVCVLPLTASDHRSLMNASRQLDKLGIDVRRS